MRWFIIPIIIIGIITFLLFIFLQSSSKRSEEETLPQTSSSNMILKSAAFKNNEYIPAKYTCDGDGINPLIEILNVPVEAKGLVLIMDDPDAPAGTWDHWLMWNIDPKTRYIEADSVPGGAIQGTTSFGHKKYGGPCPPRGHKPHRYMFKVYTLDTLIDLQEGAKKGELEKAMEGHILDQAVLIGLYQRK